MYGACAVGAVAVGADPIGMPPVFARIGQFELAWAIETTEALTITGYDETATGSEVPVSFVRAGAVETATGIETGGHLDTNTIVYPLIVSLLPRVGYSVSAMGGGAS